MWSAYIKGSAKRQDFWERALQWVSGSDSVGAYLGAHRKDESIKPVEKYFDSVIDWVSTVFSSTESEMRGLEWGRLYEAHHKTAYNPAHVAEQVQSLYGDSYVKNRKGIWEYVLGGSTDTKLLEIRVFDDATKKSVFAKQTKAAESAGDSNCPLCALGHDANKAKLWKLEEMDADHVAAWSKGGATSAENCQLLCKTHNRAKGNK